MVVSLSGSSGFIGQALIRKMRDRGWTFRIIGRDSFKKPDAEFSEEFIEGSDVVINLAGAPVATKWTAGYKKEIMDSRILTTRKIATAINHAEKKPEIFISASAIGIYDSVNTHGESSTGFSGSFLAQVCREWEKEAMNSQQSTRVVIMRTGMVLGSDGGALKKMHLPFSIGLGAKIGKGNQHISFIHLNDLTEAIAFITENKELSGVVNAVTPYPTSNEEFSDRLAKVLGQSCMLTIPPFALRIMYGEGAQVLLEGQRVLPEKLEQAGFRFKYPTLLNALVQIYG
ncbi:MAG: TIGR01777 family oxidoreductase [Bacteroidota bacterium]